MIELLQKVEKCKKHFGNPEPQTFNYLSIMRKIHNKWVIPCHVKIWFVEGKGNKQHAFVHCKSMDRETGKKLGLNLTGTQFIYLNGC